MLLRVRVDVGEAVEAPARVVAHADALDARLAGAVLCRMGGADEQQERSDHGCPRRRRR